MDDRSVAVRRVSVTRALYAPHEEDAIHAIQDHHRSVVLEKIMTHWAPTRRLSWVSHELQCLSSPRASGSAYSPGFDGLSDTKPPPRGSTVCLPAAGTHNTRSSDTPTPSFWSPGMVQSIHATNSTNEGHDVLGL